MGLVRQIADKNGNWYYYDINFRRLKNSMKLSWSDIEHELFIMAMSKKMQPFRSGREVAPGKHTPYRGNKPIRNHRSCDKFNKGSSCEGCNFPHICSFCGKPNHPQYKCFSKSEKIPKTTNQTLMQMEMNPHNQNQQDQASQAHKIRLQLLSVGYVSNIGYRDTIVRKLNI